MVALFSEEHLNELIWGLQKITPDHLHLDEFIRDALEDIREQSHAGIRTHDATQNDHIISGGRVSTSDHALHHSNVLAYWSMLMTCVLLYFTLSCVEQFAQFYQATIDKVLY